MTSRLTAPTPATRPASPKAAGQISSGIDSSSGAAEPRSAQGQRVVAGVDHGDDDASAAARETPRLERVAVRIGVVVEAPEPGDLGILGDHEGLDDKVGRCSKDVGIL